MIRSVFACLAVALGVTTALAQTDPIAERQKIMKANSAATRVGAQMVKGDVTFDLAKAQDILKTYANAAKNAHELFPASSKTGGETAASPKIWENEADFRARFDQWGRDIEKAAQQTKDLDTFKASFATVTQACNSCHETYRLKKS
jgi:cytochrome c556